MGFQPDSPVFKVHERGKLVVRSTLPLVDRESLSLAYTPGVAEVCMAIHEDERLARDYTWRSRLVAVISDGTAVLGLGNIGPLAALPVMEGKAALFSEFAGINAVPIVLNTTDADEIVETVARLAPSFGGINLEDISAPRCFDIERALRARLQIPVFHDDQHGTAIVVLAALRNAARVTGRSWPSCAWWCPEPARPASHAPRSCSQRESGTSPSPTRAACCTRAGRDLTAIKAEMARITNRPGLAGSLHEAMAGADVFLGVSAGEVTRSRCSRWRRSDHLRPGEPEARG